MKLVLCEVVIVVGFWDVVVLCFFVFVMIGGISDGLLDELFLKRDWEGFLLFDDLLFKVILRWWVSWLCLGVRGKYIGCCGEWMWIIMRVEYVYNVKL